MKSKTVPMFPYANGQQVPGMLLRDHFAAHAMAALITNLGQSSPRQVIVERVGKSAFEIADAMLDARDSGI